MMNCFNLGFYSHLNIVQSTNMDFKKCSVLIYVMLPALCSYNENLDHLSPEYVANFIIL